MQPFLQAEVENLSLKEQALDERIRLVAVCGFTWTTIFYATEPNKNMA
jgi:hypothetical protein